MMFILQSDEPRRKNRCRECWLKNNVKSWQEEMYKMGCDVDNPDKLGEVPFIKPRRKSECLKVEVDGEIYTDVTGLLFESTKVVKTYLNKDEWREIERKKEEERKRMVQEEKREEIDKALAKEMYEVSLKERIKAMVKDKATRGEIVSKLNITTYMVDKITKELIDEGKAKPFRGRIYSDELNEEIKAMYKNGCSYKEIGKAIDKPYRSIWSKIDQWKQEGVI